MCSIKPCYTGCQPQGEKEKTPVGPQFFIAPQNIHSVGPVEKDNPLRTEQDCGELVLG